MAVAFSSAFLATALAGLSVLPSVAVADPGVFSLSSHWPHYSVFDDRPDGCPPCFNCNLDDFECQQFGECRKASGRCNCPAGFGGVDCSEPLCGSLPLGSDRTPRNGSSCACDDGWGGINCNVCQTDVACNAMMPEGVDGVCYKDGLTVKESFQMCDITNVKIVEQLKDRKPQATFSCNAEDDRCNFQFWVGEQESFYCDLDTCTSSREAEPTRNTTSYTCENVQCACIPGRMLCGESGSVDIGDFLKQSITGPATFKSVKTEGGSAEDGSSFSEPSMNKLIQMFFGDASIFLRCSSGECLYRTDVPGYVKPIKGINTPLIAATIAGCSLFLLASILFVWFMSRLEAESGYRIQLRGDDDGFSEDGDDSSEGGDTADDVIEADFRFSDVSYRVNEQTILSGVKGSVKAGNLLAIMGASGAGKTTLLDIIARKNKAGNVSGNFYINNEHMTDSEFNRVVGFVDQDDALVPTLTVHETIMDSAMLRLPKNWSIAKKERLVKEVEEALGILNKRDDKIGSVDGGRVISGGEKRRVSIACELVTSPSILFLDEPTSGLDAASAYGVVQSLSKLARSSRRTIIFTIHQPRPNIVSLFDDLVLLSRGNLVYSGPMAECADYFSDLKLACPPHVNITDHLIDLTVCPSEEQVEVASSSLSTLSTTTTERSPPASPVAGQLGELDLEHDRLIVQTRLVEAFQRYSAGIESGRASSGSASSDATAGAGAVPSQSGLGGAKSVGYDKVGYVGQTVILCRRTWRNLYRNPMLMLTHYTIAIVLAVTLGYLFYGLSDDIKGFQNRLGLFFFLLSLFGFSTLTSLGTFSDERLLFERERAKGYYYPISYFTAKVGFDIVPLRLIPPLIIGTIIYPMTGLVPDWPPFFWFMSFLVLFNLAASAMCLFIGVMFKNAGVANLMGILVMLFSLLFSGFLLNQETVPAGLRWVQNLSIFHYAFEGLIVNEVVTLTLVDRKYGLDIEVPGAAILSSFGFDTQARLGDCAGLAAFGLVFVGAAYSALHFFLYEKR